MTEVMTARPGSLFWGGLRMPPGTPSPAGGYLLLLAALLFANNDLYSP